MKQILQNQKNGEIFIDDLPAPALPDGFVLVRTHFSAISAGTERTSVTTAQANLLRKARSRPDLVRQVIDNARREGLTATYRKVQSRLEGTKVLGYSASGVVIESRSDQYQPGDRVACAGGGYASHAEIIAVPQNLCARLPEEVSLEDAAMTTLGAIALQGIRQAEIQAGAAVAIVGLGLLGQISLQLLRAMGCTPIGLDISDFAVARGRDNGAHCLRSDLPGAVAAVLSLTGGRGADAVLLTAGTSSNAPIELAGEIARDRAVVVIVGSVKADIPRSPYFEKELTVRLSRSYGPGRYDPAYEEYGLDYPAGYVRWTEQRNMETILRFLASGLLRFDRIVTHRFPFDRAVEAYDLITGGTSVPYLGILLAYDTGSAVAPLRTVERIRPGAAAGELNVAFIGAGNFAQSYLLPPLTKEPGMRFGTVVTRSGVNAVAVAKKFLFARSSTDPESVFSDPEIGLVFIATRHATHAELAARAVRAGKPVFVEKPLAISEEQLSLVADAVREQEGRLMVGFNRRFSMPVRRVRDFFSGRVEPLSMIYRVNAGALPPASWVQDPAQGGRIVGEACHFVDVMHFLAGAPPVTVAALCHRPRNALLPEADVMTLQIGFEDGSIGALHYFANGDPALEKEYLEVFGQGRSAVMNNFRSCAFYRERKKTVERFDGTKGHAEEMHEVVDAAKRGSPFPISFDDALHATRVTFAALESLRAGRLIRLR